MYINPNNDLTLSDYPSQNPYPYPSVSAYHTHHQADLYPEPERFLPSRWEPIRPSPYEYLPFDAGKRMCREGFYALRGREVFWAP